MDVKIEKIKWKYYFQQKKEISESDEDKLFALFDTWINQENDIFIDVVDYKHVHYGTKIFLSGVENSYAIESEGEDDGKYSFCYLRNTPFHPSTLTNTERLFTSFDAFIEKMHLLQKHFANQKEALSFDLQCLVLQINDRALYPNEEKYFLALKSELEKFLSARLTALGKVKITWDSKDNIHAILNVTMHNENLSSLSSILTPAK